MEYLDDEHGEFDGEPRVSDTWKPRHCAKCGHGRFYVVDADIMIAMCDVACVLCGKQMRIAEEWVEDGLVELVKK